MQILKYLRPNYPLCLHNLVTLLALKIGLHVSRIQRQYVPRLALGASHGREVHAQLGWVHAAAALAREMFGLLQNDL